MRPRGTPIGLKLARASKVVGQAFNAALTSEGGSVPIWMILNSLSSAEWRRQRDLAQSLGIEGPTLTRHLDGLERAGLVRRQGDSSDRRVTRLELTEAGQQAHKRMLGAVIAFNRRLNAGLSDDELGQLRLLLDRLVENVGGTVNEGIPR